MSWTDELYKIYENNCGRTDCAEVLLPISHSTANAQIEITLSWDGEFITACKVVKSEAVTIIPVTEDSGARGSGITPHPLNDKLIYLAGDYKDYVLSEKTEKNHFDAYLKQLQGWCESDCAHSGAKAVYDYLSKKCLIADLLRSQILVQDEETGKLKEKVKIEGIAQEDAFVRFKIHYQDLMHENNTWADKTLFDSFIAYNSKNMGEKQLCYATGKTLPCTYKHPAKIRNAGDKAKLISANDENGFSYRGRFDNKEQANSVSYDFSQKMHNALKWLIIRQGIPLDSLTLVVWESALQDIPNITKSFEDEMEFDDEETVIDTVPAYKKQLSSMIFAYKEKLDLHSKIMIAAFDAATPGRLSMCMYSELATTDFCACLEKWHMDTAWFQFSGKRKKKIINSFSPYDIAECAFSTEQNGFLKCKPEIKKDILLRLIPCITQARKVPPDILSALVHKASNPLAYKEHYNQRRVLETACGLIRKSIIEKKGECEMALDENITDRSYLFGRLLAVADKAEYDTYDDNDKKARITNAKRYWHSFSKRPYQTWQIIEERLRPYLDKLGGLSVFYTKRINEIMSKIPYEEFTVNKPLEPAYLLGYHCQMDELYNFNKNKED